MSASEFFFGFRLESNASFKSALKTVSDGLSAAPSRLATICNSLQMGSLSQLGLKLVLKVAPVVVRHWFVLRSAYDLPEILRHHIEPRKLYIAVDGRWINYQPQYAVSVTRSLSKDGVGC
ncbi:hypothetical protein [Albidovulum sp.]|uniref:hypothetical protein n=1 Tax=Albidovulum sp. TaxID=1872424 RepID=UPI003D7C3B93